MDASERRLTNEIWELMMADGGAEVEEMLSMKKREDRRGRCKRLLCKAIRESSLGVFNGQIHFFSGSVYASIGTRAFKDIIRDIMDRKAKMPDADLVKLADIYEDCLNVVYGKPLKIDNGVMLFKNGVLDVNAGKFYKRFDKKFVQMWSVDYEYNPQAKTFKWYQFINQVLPDKYLQDVLQMFLGATFVDRAKVKIEHILILLGKGANGKSVIQRAVCGVLGEEYVATQEVGRLCSRGIDGDEAVALINGRRLNYCTEMETTDFYRKSARLKAIVSGEKVPARFRYGIGFDAMNIPLLMANANQLPIFNKKDDALLRRIYVIPFDVVIPPEKQNKTLNDELTEEYPAILNWILEGREKFIENGYRLPTDVNLNRIVLAGESEFNLPLKFMSVNGWMPKIQGVDIEPLNWIKLRVLYSGYERWCEQNELECIGKTAFCHVLETEGGYIKKRYGDGIRFAVYGDITINTLKRESKKLRRVEIGNPKAQLMWVDGTAWITSQKALAAYAGVGDSTVRRLIREGRFKEHTKAWREKKIYDVKACCAVMRSLKIIATDEEKAIQSRILKELKYLRYIFNQRMMYNGWPYRKYSLEEPQIDGTITVPDTMSDAEVYEMAKAAGYDLSHWERFGKGRGIFGKGGKGFFNDVSEIPSDEEKKMLD